MSTNFIDTTNEIKNIQEREKIVAFIDILGFKNKVEKEPDNVGIIDLIMIINQEAAKDDLVTFMFSDCMYIIGDELSKILKLIACLQTQLLCASSKHIPTDKENFRYSDLNLVRGGITKGKISYNKKLNIFWGESVNRAYELESQNAFYPRIIVDRQIDTFLNNDYFRQDFDGLSYFDFLKYWKYEREGFRISEEEINGMKEYIEILTRNESNENILRKMGWFYNYISEYACKL